MSSVPQQFGNKFYRSSTTELAEPFLAEVEEVFTNLEALGSDDLYRPGTPRPSKDTINWAKEVLLRILPRKYLRGAEIDAFQVEIHVTWENDDKGKKVVVFLPAPQQLKIYYESVCDGAVEDHNLVSTTNAHDISERLRWFFQ